MRKWSWARRSNRRSLSSGLRGAEELIEIGVGGKVPNDGLHRAHMQPESVRNGRGGESVSAITLQRNGPPGWQTFSRGYFKLLATEIG